MKHKFLTGILCFLVIAVSAMAIDCGCAYAGPADVSAHEHISIPEGMDCHGSQEPKTKPSEDYCCTGCQLESKAPVPPKIGLSTPAQHPFAGLLKASGTDAPGIGLPSFPLQRSMKIKHFPLERTQSVPVYDLPIYLAVQSLLI